MAVVLRFCLPGVVEAFESTSIEDVSNKMSSIDTRFICSAVSPFYTFCSYDDVSAKAFGTTVV